MAEQIENLDSEERPGRDFRVEGDDSVSPRAQEKFTKRIGREVKKTKLAQTRAEVAEEESARARKELADLRKQTANSQEESLDTRMQALDKEETALRERLRKAGDETDVPEITKVTEELHDNQKNREEVRSKRQTVIADLEVDDADTTRQYKKKAGPCDEAQDWLDDNPRFNDDDEFRKVALELNTSLLKQYKVDDQRLYDELDKQLAEKFDDASEEEDASGYETPDAAPPPSQRDTPASGVSKRLTDRDLRLMRLAGFDPSNPANRQAWMRRNEEL